jgi:hypothetical protein
VLDSTVEIMEGLERMVPSEDLDPFNEGFAATAEMEMMESREGGGGGSGKAGASGDCNLEEGTETTTGEDTAVPAGLFGGAGFLTAWFLAPTRAPASKGSGPCSLLPPTEAFKRLYRPLRPLWTISKLLASLVMAAGGGDVRSSKVVRPEERDAAACSWWSDPDAGRESCAMVVRGGQAWLWTA